MPRILLIDDEYIYYKMIVHALKPLGYEIEYARNGLEGLTAVPIVKPDVVITDVRMPDLSGYEVAQRLRRDPRFSNIPIVFLTNQADLSNKLKAFESGADDYLSKPFQPEELVARVGVLVRRSEAMRLAQKVEETTDDGAVITTVHSLRGGVGTSSVAVNLAVGFYSIWEKPTLLIDSVLNAGQVALMLNASPKYTWADLTEYKPYELDSDLLKTIINHHPIGIDFIAAPNYPIAGDTFSDDFWHTALEVLKKEYEFIVIDTAHDFSNVSIQMLDPASYIMLVMAPDMASIRAAVCALSIYDKLGYSHDRVIPLVNNIFEQAGIKQAQVEKALNRPVGLSLPYAQSGFVKAINYGEPLIATNPESPASVIIENTAYKMSKELMKNIPPAAPTQAWRRVTSRAIGKK
jgi:pilus assembly protein CpaE